MHTYTAARPIFPSLSSYSPAHERLRGIDLCREEREKEKKERELDRQCRALCSLSHLQ